MISLERSHGKMAGCCCTAMTPVILLSPILAKDGQPWHFLVSIPLAIANAVLCHFVIAWGKMGTTFLYGTERQLWDAADASSSGQLPLARQNNQGR